MQHVEAWVAIWLPLSPLLAEETFTDSSGPRSLAAWLAGPLILRAGDIVVTPYNYGLMKIKKDSADSNCEALKTKHIEEISDIDKANVTPCGSLHRDVSQTTSIGQEVHPPEEDDIITIE